MISDWATLGSSVQCLEKRRMNSAGLLGACAQIPGVSRAHVHALEVPHEGADQIVPVMNLAGRQVLVPRSRRVSEVQRRLQMMTSSAVAPPS
jgi:hypothetical protein